LDLTPVADHLRQERWTIERLADTASRARGFDILASKDGRAIAVEVKGYPSTRYAHGVKQGQPKPTNPTVQAPH